MLNARQEFASYAQKYMAEGDARITQASTGRKTVRPNFVVDDGMVADFRAQLVTDKIKIDDEGFVKDLDFIKSMIRFEIDTALFGVSEAWRHQITADPQAQLAMQEFGEAQRLTDLTKGGARAGR
jgi:hypothetical protein